MRELTITRALTRDRVTGYFLPDIALWSFYPLNYLLAPNATRPIRPQGDAIASCVIGVIVSCEFFDDERGFRRDIAGDFYQDFCDAGVIDEINGT